DRLAVVGVLTSDRPAAARDFVRAYGATWPVGLDPAAPTPGRWGAVGPPPAFARPYGATWPVGLAPAATTAGRWGAVGLPHTYFVRPDGTLASHQLGELTRPALDRQLALIL